MLAGKKSIIAVYKTGTGTRRRRHWDVCVGTCDSGTRDEGIGDIKYGTRGTCGTGTPDVKYRDAGDAGCVGRDVNDYCDNCDFNHFPREYVLVKAAHPTLLPPCLFTKQRLGENPLH